MVDQRGFQPRLIGCKPIVLALTLPAHVVCFRWMQPPRLRIRSERFSLRENHPQKCTSRKHQSGELPVTAMNRYIGQSLMRLLFRDNPPLDGANGWNRRIVRYFGCSVCRATREPSVCGDSDQHTTVDTADAARKSRKLRLEPIASPDIDLR